MFNANASRVIGFLGGSARKGELCGVVAKAVARGELTHEVVRGVLNGEMDEQENEGKLDNRRFSDSEIKDFMRNLLVFSPALAVCALKQ